MLYHPLRRPNDVSINELIEHPKMSYHPLLRFNNVAINELPQQNYCYLVSIASTPLCLAAVHVCLAASHVQELSFASQI